MTEIRNGIEFHSADTTSAGSPPPVSRSAEAESDMQKLHALLTKGEDAIVRRKDLGELHKRIVAMLTTLNQGLGEAQAAKASEDRAQLVERLNQIERAVNSMEGALRIELEPLIGNIVAKAVSAAGSDGRRTLRRPVQTLITALCLVGFGAYFSDAITSAGKVILSRASVGSSDAGFISSLIRGIPEDPNPIK